MTGAVAAVIRTLNTNSKTKRSYLVGIPIDNSERKMIKHIVLWKLKENVEGKLKADNARMLKRELESLPGKIKEIRTFEVGINFSTEQDAYDLSLIAEFANKNDLETYLNHPEHQRVVTILRRLRDSRIVVDYEV
jgi:hypothetical protein